MERAKTRGDLVLERFIDSSIDFIESRILKNFEELTPEVARKIELLEVLVVSVVEHGDNPNLLNDLELHINAMAGLNGQSLQ